MSHELRTPLNVILGFSQLMYRDDSLNAEQRENLRIMHRSGDHLLNLINDILDLSKIEAAHLTLEPIPFNLLDLLYDVRDMFSERAADRELQFFLDLASELPRYVVSDPTRLRQVLINLLGNAIKFTPEGQVTLRVRGEPAATDASTDMVPYRLHFEVEDTGVGIDAEDLPTIFDAFAQAQAGKMALEGTGLGLAISQKTVQMMGGDITVKSIKGKGSTFRFHLLVHLAEAMDEPLVPRLQQVMGLAPDQPTYRILVVDDQPENRQLLVKLLQHVGFSVEEATNGKEAVTRWQQWQPHLIWMDIRMPHLDGCAATQYIRTLEQTRPVKETSLTADHPISQTIILALTAQTAQCDRQRALASGCNDVVSKPVQTDVLFQKMAEHLNIRYLYKPDPIDRHASPPLRNAGLGGNQTRLHRLSVDDLRVMPPQWLKALHQASLNCDESEVYPLIAQIPPEHGALIQGLNALTRDYQFDWLVRISQPHTPDR